MSQGIILVYSQDSVFMNTAIMDLIQQYQDYYSYKNKL